MGSVLERSTPKYENLKVTREEYLDLGEKSERYLKNEVPEYWILDPESNRFEVRYNRKTEWEIVTGDQ